MSGPNLQFMPDPRDVVDEYRNQRRDFGHAGSATDSFQCSRLAIIAYVLAILLASAIAASTESIVRHLRNNAKGGLRVCYIAAVRWQSSVTAVRTRKCIVEFLHDGLR
jgi:hypothetical protein